MSVQKLNTCEKRILWAVDLTELTAAHSRYLYNLFSYDVLGQNINTKLQFDGNIFKINLFNLSDSI